MIVSTLFSLALSTIGPGPEVPLGHVALGNAAYNQRLDGIASNGDDYLALWSDERDALYTGRVDAAGHPITPSGHKLAENAAGRLTWAGDTYLTVYCSGQYCYEQALDRDGIPSGPATRIEAVGSPREIASNGSSVVVLNSVGEYWLLARNGAVICRGSLTSPY